MSGVVAAMRRTLLSCTSLARCGVIALAAILSASSEPALAVDLTIPQAISALLDLNHQESAALTTALSLLGFTVVASAIKPSRASEVHDSRVRRIAATTPDIICPRTHNFR